MATGRSRAAVSPPGAGTRVPHPDTGGTATIRLLSDATGGAVTVWESARARGDTGGPGLHSHPGFDEVFYVLTGEYEFTVSGETVEAPTGTAVFVPRGAFHTFTSRGNAAARLLAIAIPGGIEDFFEEMASSPPRAGPAEVREKHRIRSPNRGTSPDNGGVREYGPGGPNSA